MCFELVVRLESKSRVRVWEQGQMGAGQMVKWLNFPRFGPRWAVTDSRLESGTVSTTVEGEGGGWGWLGRAGGSSPLGSITRVWRQDLTFRQDITSFPFCPRLQIKTAGLRSGRRRSGRKESNPTVTDSSERQSFFIFVLCFCVGKNLRCFTVPQIK